MTFPLKAVKVICCPANEKEEIIELLVEHANSVDVVESWKEYDDVTTYLKRRKKAINSSSLERIDQISDKARLVEMKQQNDQTFHTLSSYYSVFKETVNLLEGKSINDTLRDLAETSRKIGERITSVVAEIKAKEDLAKKIKITKRN